MQCPRCDGSLAPLRAAGRLEVDYCQDCGGVWYDAGEFAAFYNLFGEMSVLTEGADHSQGVTCPRCKIATVEVTYPPNSGIRVDTCPSCEGLWLDKGEVSDLRERVRALQEAAGLLDLTAPQAEAPKEEASEETPPFQWQWAVLGFVIILVAQVVLAGLLSLSAALTEVGDQEAALSAGTRAAISALLGYPVGGFLIGRLSPGFTVIEPAAAAIPAGVIFWLRFGQDVGLLLMIVLVVAGVVLSVLGAAGGETRQAR
jgi:Zn-finger nucleic acid-binding protein